MIRINMQIDKFNPPYPLKTAVLFLVFNRLETTMQVFEAIREAKPPRIYIAADGARVHLEGEVKKVQDVRDYVMQNIDWECEVKTLFRDENLGCKYAVSRAVTWFFENEEQGMILEDDCLPSQSFFWLCEELLERYKNDESVYLVSGDARASESFEMKEDYTFCKYPMLWGWASWADVWKRYDAEIQDWPKLKDSLIQSISGNKSTQNFWYDIFQKMYHKQINTWDYQFCYLLFRNKAKCITPRLNLISNIGFGIDATHTTNLNSQSSNRKKFEYSFPISHHLDSNSEMLTNKFYDENEFIKRGLFMRVINKLSRTLIKKND